MEIQESIPYVTIQDMNKIAEAMGGRIIEDPPWTLESWCEAARLDIPDSEEQHCIIRDRIIKLEAIIKWGTPVLKQVALEELQWEWDNYHLDSASDYSIEDY